MTQYAPATDQATPEGSSDEPSRPTGRAVHRLGIAALWLFAAIPAGLALRTAVKAPRMHVLLDYWHVLAKITDDSGHLEFGQVFTYHLDQPFIVPSLLFWTDAAWLGGDNRALTILTVLLTAGIVLALRTMLPATLSPVRKTALTAAMSWLLLSSHAAELWLQGTNGISWVPAVFFCTVAIAYAHRGRPWPAGIAATLGCLSFGAALPIWFVIALIFWLRNDTRRRVLVPGVIGLVVVIAWWSTKPAGQQSLATSAFDPDGRLSVVAAALGGLWSADLAVIAVIAGAATLLALALLSARTILDRPVTQRDAGWVGLAAYSLALAIMLGLGRTTGQVPGGNVGLISRYVLIAALATTALLALWTLHRPQWPLRYTVALIVTISLATHAIGGIKADNVRGGYTPLALAAVALRVDAPTVLDTLHIQRGVIPATKALQAYPFSPSFTLGCGGPELGDHFDASTATPLTTSQGAINGTTLTADSLITGWATIDTSPPDCILVTDNTGTIVGGGVTGLPRTATQPPTTPDGSTWQAVAAPHTTGLNVIAAKNGTFHRLQPAPATP